MDYIAAWKATSIAFTGAFGVVGLLRDYKDKKTGKITKWGAFSLGGILLSTCCGIAVQLKESADDTKSRKIDVARALALADTTNRTVKDIERQMKSLTGARLNIYFTFQCQDIKNPSSYCQYVDSDKYTPFTIFNIDLFKDQASAKVFLENGASNALVSEESGHDLSILVMAGGDKAQTISAFPQFVDGLSGGAVAIRGYLPYAGYDENDGRIYSSVDLPGAIGILSLIPRGLKPDSIDFVLQSGEMIRYTGAFQPVALASTVAGTGAFQFSYPK
jgi:hypothetical protein